MLKLFTMDVKGANITTDLGINAFIYWMDKYPQNINSYFRKEYRQAVFF